MMTWQIMMGAELVSMVVSIGVVVAFMLKKEPVDAAEKKAKQKHMKGTEPAVI